MSDNTSMMLAKPVGDSNNLKALLAHVQGQMQAVIPKHLTPERLLKIALIAASRNPRLLECTKASILQSVMVAAELGLEPDGKYGALVPYRNKGVMEAQFQPMYQGLLRLARNTGEISTVEAHVVREKDTFELEFGLEAKLKHVPYLKENPGEMLFAYAVGVLKDGTKQCEVMTRAQIQHVRNKSKAKDQGPWVDDTEEMWRKTVTKRLCKYLPSSPELDTALDADDRAEIGEVPLNTNLPSLPAASEEPEKPQEEDAKEKRNRIVASLAERTRNLGINLKSSEFTTFKTTRFNVTAVADMTEKNLMEWDSLLGDVEENRITREEFITGVKTEPEEGKVPLSEIVEEKPVEKKEEPVEEKVSLREIVEGAPAPVQQEFMVQGVMNL